MATYNSFEYLPVWQNARESLGHLFTKLRLEEN
jgi:hypothetical protein